MWPGGRVLTGRCCLIFYSCLLVFFRGPLVFAQTPPLQGTGAILASFKNLNIQGVAIDSTGAIVVAGTTTEAGYPTTSNAVQSNYRATSCYAIAFSQPCTDAYVARIARGGTVLYATYFGGSNNDGVTHIAVDETNAIYLLGNTASSDFPFSQPPSNSTAPFLVKIGAGGTWSFALRLPAGLGANQIRSGGGGEIVLGGECIPASISWTATFYTANLPRTSGACYVRLAPNGTDIVASTILGSSNEALANDIVLDASGNAYMTGKSFPPDFPTTGNSWIATTPQTFYDFTIFAAKVSRDGTM
jgi:hypothetical protein